MSSLVSLEPFVYPLKGYIRFEVEDIAILEDAPRFSKPVKVGANEWCLRIEMECSIRTNNLKLLNIYLVLTRYNFDEEEIVSAVKSSALSLGKASKTFEPPLSQHTIHKKGVYGTHWGQGTAVDMTMMLEQGYGKNEKLIVEFNFEVLSEKFTCNKRYCESMKPSEEDIKNMLSGVEFKSEEKTVDAEFNVSEISSNMIHSHDFYIDDVPFKIGVVKAQAKNHLAVDLYCNPDDESVWWGVEATAEFRIINRQDPTKFLRRSFPPLVFSKRMVIAGRGFDWDEVSNLENGYVKYGRICMKVTVSIRNKYGFDQITGKGIEKTLKKMTDAVFKVEGREFHVSRMILSHHSPWFSELFHNDPREDIPSLLELLDKYGAEECITSLDHRLSNMDIKIDSATLKLIDKYGLNNLKKTYINNKLRDLNEMTCIFMEDRYILELIEELTEALTQNINSNEHGEEPLHMLSKRSRSTETSGAEKLLEESVEFNRLPKSFIDPSDMVTMKFNDNKIFYSSKQILANASEHFMKRFFGPHANDDDNTLIFQNISSKTFYTLLIHIYHPSTPINEKNIDVLLSLGLWFTVTDVLNVCESYLIKSKDMTVNKKEEYAMKYNLKYLLSACKNYKEKNI